VKATVNLNRSRNYDSVRKRGLFDGRAMEKKPSSFLRKIFGKIAPNCCSAVADVAAPAADAMVEETKQEN